MYKIAEKIGVIRQNLPTGVTLVCVSKYQSEDAIREAYYAGERDFGESHVQELCQKYADLPKDIRWHMIGHLQTNKVRQIVPFVHLIQSVDSWHLLETIEKEASRVARVVHVLLEVHVAREESKSGMTIEELQDVLPRLTELKHVQVDGLMTMATNTEEEYEVRRCFKLVESLKFKVLISASLERSASRMESSLKVESGKTLILSYGMSDDYKIAIEEGSNMIRIGSRIFGERS